MSSLNEDSSSNRQSTVPATAADRQTIIRHLVDRVVVDVQGDSEHVDATIHWHGGYVSQHAMIRPVGSYEQLSGYKELMARAEELRSDGQTSDQIADQLNGEGFHSPSGRKFNASTVRQLLRSHSDGSRRLSAHECPKPPYWRPSDLAQQLDVPIRKLHNWLRRGWVYGKQSTGAHGRWVLWADDEELNRLTKLREYGLKSSGLPAPRELTTPKPQPEN